MRRHTFPCICRGRGYDSGQGKIPDHAESESAEAIYGVQPQGEGGPQGLDAPGQQICM